MNNFIEQFKKEIANFEPGQRPKDMGTVTRVGDGVAEVEGLAGAQMSEMVRFDIAHGKKLPLEFTFSCLNPKGYEHCGECNKCVERKKAFFAACVFDKTKYKKPGI